jgi:hypothetical protein
VSVYLVDVGDYGEANATCDAGTLRLSVWYVGGVADEVGGFRRQHGYRVESTIPGAYAVHEGEDLHSGVDAPVDADAAVRTLASFLSAAGESYRYALNHPGSEPENLGLFPSWVAEAAYLNGDELAMLAAEEELLDDPTTDPAVPAMYVSVVFQQGDDASDTLNILNESGPQAAVDHLVQWDFGRETEEAAEVYDGIYDEPPAGADDRTYASGEYVMTYSHAYGHVGLVRKLDQPTDNPTRPRVAAPSAPMTRRRRLGLGDVGGEISSGGESPWTRSARSPRRTSGLAHPRHDFG